MAAGRGGVCVRAVEGDGVHEIPVGPVHAGIIEPGHFRFQVVGEKVLRLEERLGYVHKGIEKRFEAMPLARRPSASPAASPATARSPTRGRTRRRWRRSPTRRCRRARAWLRALLLERERIANHLGDLGYLGNDGGFAFGLAQFSRLKEDVLRTNLARLRPPAADGLRRAGRRRARPRARGRGRASATNARCSSARSASLRDIYDEHAGLQDRFRTCGMRDAGARGAARPDRPRGPRERPGVRPALRLSGRALRRARRAHGDDATAATSPRASRCASTRSPESLRLVRAIVDACPHGDVARAGCRSRRHSGRASATSKAGADRCWSR